MAKEIKFNIKLTIDGKEQIVAATSSTKELQEAMDKAKEGSQRLNTSLVNFNQSIEALTNVADAVAKISGALNSITEESRSFSAAMNAANTMAGKSGDDFAKLKDKVADLSKTLPVARDELANGLYQVISNGVPEDNWITYLQSSARASVGGIADLGEAVKVTSTVIKNYGLEWSAAGEIQDKIQLTAKNGVTSFEQLAEALPMVTGSAATLGVSIDELMAAFATLTGVSGNTAEVSTQLSAIFTALVKPSSQAADMAKAMGIEFDAAAIKAAGGMHNFLVSLDKDVKAYSQKSGMLEQEIYAQLFGSARSLRALIPLTGQLSDKFGENVEAMKGSAGTMDKAFATMSNSGAASFQMLKNKFAEVTDAITSVFSGILPYLNIASQVGYSVVAIATLRKALVDLSTAESIVKIRTLAMNGAVLLWRNVALWGTAVTNLLRAAFTGAAIGATTARVAIRGLLISTGVGIAIVALTEALNYFINSVDDAGDSASQAANGVKGLGEAADEVKMAYENGLKNTYSDLMSKYEKLRTAWKALTSSHQRIEWIKANQQAFEELGIKVDNVKEAEDIFNRNTAAVVESFKRRAEAAAYAAKLTALYQQQIAVLEKKRKAQDKVNRDNKTRINTTQTTWVDSDGREHHNDDSGVDTKRRQQNKQELDDISKQEKEINAQIDDTAKQLAAAQKEAAKGITPARRGGKPDKKKKKKKEKKTKKDPPKDHLTIAPLPEVKGIKQGTDEDKRKSRENAQSRISRLQDDYATGIIDKDKALEAIEVINGKLKGLGVKPIEVRLKTNIDDLQEQLQQAHNELDEATTIEAKVKADAKIREIQAKIDEETKGKVTIKATTEPTYITEGSDADKRQSRDNAQTNISRIANDYEAGIIDKDKALHDIADINAQLQALGVKPIEIRLKTSIDELQEQLQQAQYELNDATTIEAKVYANAKVQQIQRQIDEATKGRVSIKAITDPTYITEGSVEDKRQSSSNAQNRIDRIKSDFEIGIIGKDDALKGIAEINKELTDLGLKPIKIQLDTEGFDKAVNTMQQAWGSVQGIGNGIKGITDALEGNGDAWESISNIINGFLSIAQGIQGIVQLVNMLSAATVANTAATTASAGAKAAETSATIANTAAKSGEAVADATASGAKLPFPLNVVAIAAGVAAVLGGLSMVGAFATGGIVGGASNTGDKKLARVNSGEMILNRFQQATLFKIANRGLQAPAFTRQDQPKIAMNVNNLGAVEPPVVNISMNLKTRKLLEVLAQDNQVAAKSGRNFI